MRRDSETLLCSSSLCHSSILSLSKTHRFPVKASSTVKGASNGLKYGVGPSSFALAAPMPCSPTWKGLPVLLLKNYFGWRCQGMNLGLSPGKTFALPPSKRQTSLLGLGHVRAPISTQLLESSSRFPRGEEPPSQLKALLVVQAEADL